MTCYYCALFLLTESLLEKRFLYFKALFASLDGKGRKCLEKKE